MHPTAELALTLGILEGLFLLFFLLARRQLAHRKLAPHFDPLEDGPWWSVWFHRVWLVSHLPVLALQLLGGWVVGRPVLLHPVVLHLGNCLLVMLAFSL